MARGRKTGGRNFKKGQGGRKKGAKDKIPRSWKANVQMFFQEVHSDQPELLTTAVVRGLKATPAVSFRFVELWLNHVYGTPTQTIKLTDLSKYTPEQLAEIERLLAIGHA